MSSSEPAAELPLDTAGSKLARAREGLGKSRKDIAAATRIQERYLAAFDSSRYEDFPARTYALGFARSYARAVGLDGDAIAAELRTELDGRPDEPAPAPTPAFTPGDPARAPTARFAKLAAAALAVVAAGVVLWHGVLQPSGSLPSLLPPVASGPAPVAGHPAAAAASPAAAQAVVFTAQADQLWVKFYDGAGNQLMQKQMAKGESYTVPANAVNPMLWTGQPDKLAITIGGKPQAPLASQRKIMRDVPVTAAALLARGAAMVPGAQVSAAPAAHLPTHHHKPVPHHAQSPDTSAPTPAAAPAPVVTPPAPAAAKPSTVSP